MDVAIANSQSPVLSDLIASCRDACSAADKPELQRLADQYIPDWTKLDWAEL